MFRARIISLFVITFVIFLSSCTPGAQSTPPPDLTPVPGGDFSQQVATMVSNVLTQTAVPPAITTPIIAKTTLPEENEAQVSQISGVGGGSEQTLYQSASLGIQFFYPMTWYLQETPGGIILTSFDPSNPPHKLKWTDQTTSVQFGFVTLLTPPASFDAWIESARQAVLANGLSISAEERFVIASQPAHRLSLVSGSGGIIHQALTSLSGRYLEINIEGNLDLARAILDSIQPLPVGGLKPPDSQMPAAGICGDAQGDPVSIALGVGPDGIPIAGRCIRITPAQHIKLINHSSGPFNIFFGEYYITLPVDSEMLLDKPIGQYLALGVHHLPMGPELWVQDSLVVTDPPPIMEYNNSAVGYRFNLPGDWAINETNSLSKEVIFSPPYGEPFIAYLSISLEFRSLDQVISSYTQYHSDAVREDTIFNGYSAVKYIFPGGRNEYFIPYGNQLLLVATDRPNDGAVQSILTTFRFMAPPQPVTHDATMADNGRTFVMNVGDKLRINLDLSYEWSAVSISDPDVIAGAGDGYFAFTSGTATLDATGNPACRNSTPACGAPSILFAITVIVQ